MAVANLNTNKVKLNSIDIAFALGTATALGSISSGEHGYTATTDAYGGYVTPEKGMLKCLFKIENTDSSASHTLHVRKGSASPFATKDLAITLPASSSKVILLNTGAYMEMEGALQGRIYFTGDNGALKVTAYEVHF